MTTRTQIGNPAGVCSRTPETAYTDTDLNTNATMRARLTAISGTTYTAAVLDQMTFNDMLYAIRLNDSPGTI